MISVGTCLGTLKPPRHVVLVSSVIKLLSNPRSQPGSEFKQLKQPAALENCKISVFVFPSPLLSPPRTETNPLAHEKFTSFPEKLTRRMDGNEAKYVGLIKQYPYQEPNYIQERPECGNLCTASLIFCAPSIVVNTTS